MVHNPYDANQSSPSAHEQKEISAEKSTYNAVSDMVVGVNARKSDNLFQGVFILVSLLIGALIGTVWIMRSNDPNTPWFAGAMVGGFIGMVFGLFASGIGLMVYRASMHIRGKHN
jgi:hypothetical protein